MIYFVSNCDYNVLSINYGKPLPDDVSVELSVTEIYDKAVDIIASIVDVILPKREIIKDSIFVEETHINIDELKEIDIIKHDRPPDEGVVIDPPVTKTFYVWSDYGTIKYFNENEKSLIIKGVEYDELTITYIGKPTFNGDIREIQKMRISDKICNDPRASNYGEVGVCEYKRIDMITHKLREDRDITVYKKTHDIKKLTLDSKDTKLHIKHSPIELSSKDTRIIPEPLPLPPTKKNEHTISTKEGGITVKSTGQTKDN